MLDAVVSAGLTSGLSFDAGGASAKLLTQKQFSSPAKSLPTQGTPQRNALRDAGKELVKSSPSNLMSLGMKGKTPGPESPTMRSSKAFAERVVGTSPNLRRISSLPVIKSNLQTVAMQPSGSPLASPFSRKPFSSHGSASSAASDHSPSRTQEEFFPDRSQNSFFSGATSSPS